MLSVKHAAVIARTVAGAAAMFASMAMAQTVANGPYYAVPAWDQTLPPATRYVILANMASQAVLDRETGLVWEKTPDTVTAAMTWEMARQYCLNKTVGGRKGWRLPAADELASLYNPAGSGSFPAALAGSPFVGLGTSAFWTSTLYVNNFGSPIILPATPFLQAVSEAYIVSFTIGGNDGVFPQNTRSSFNAWCVRGGSVGNVQ